MCASRTSRPCRRARAFRVAERLPALVLSRKGAVRGCSLCAAAHCMTREMAAVLSVEPHIGKQIPWSISLPSCRRASIALFLPHRSSVRRDSGELGVGRRHRRARRRAGAAEIVGQKAIERLA